VGFDQIASRISEQNWPEVEAKRFIEGFFREWLDSGKIPSETAPRSWTRFCDNIHAL
jgi:hypothetical protein